MIRHRPSRLIPALARQARDRVTALLMLCASMGLGAILASPAQGVTTCTAPTNGATQTITLSAIVPRDAPNGTKIGLPAQFSVRVTCPPLSSPGRSGFYFQTRNTPSQALPDTWATGIAGVGIRLTNVTENRVLSVEHNPDFVSWSETDGINGMSRSYTFSFQLVKTGTITGPLSATLPFMTWQIHNLSEDKDQLNVQSFILKESVTVPTCSASVPPVPLPTKTPADFPPSSVGILVGATPFTISLNCPIGSPDNTVNVLMTLADSSPGAPNNGTSDNLGIATGAGNATGVKIRLQHASDKKDVYYGAASSAVSSSQFPVGTLEAQGKTLGVDLIAYYVSTAPQVTVGNVVGSATFTMSYQ